MRKALILGVTGQDGAYLAKNLIEKNYSIIGITRDNRIENLKNLEKLKIADEIRLNKIDINNYNEWCKHAC